MERSLDPEISFFSTHLDSLRAQARDAGKDAVLIYDRHVVGFYDSVVEAGVEGYGKFGDGFLARSVSDDCEPSVASIFSAE